MRDLLRVRVKKKEREGTKQSRKSKKKETVKK
jgi:hypothetical protein